MSNMSDLLKLSLFFMVICCLIQPWAAQTTNYCNSNLCRDKVHIACNNKGNFDQHCSADARIIPMDPTLQQLILTKHNALRNRVAEGKLNGFMPAIRMATMVWDRELAHLATLNVKQRQMKHDQCRSTLAFRYAGQNLAFKGWMGMNLKISDVALELIQDWFDEYKNANMRDMSKLQTTDKFKDIGHFTALMQEKNNRVGCSILSQNKNAFTYLYMACNYAYTNFLGQAVYRQGPTASKCTTGRNQKFPGLCSANERYNVNSVSF